MSKPLSDFEKVGRVEKALRIERDRLRKTGGPENIRGSNAIATYLSMADTDSKLMLANILLDDIDDETVVRLRQA